MTMKILRTIITITLLSFTLWTFTTTTAHAQIIFGTENEASNNGSNRMGGPAFYDNVDEETPAPINGLLGLGLLVGAYLGYRQLKTAEK